MSRWRFLVAWIILASWMPATLHCALEAAGVLEVGACCDSDAHAAEATTDECAPIDRTLYNGVAGDLVVSSPILHVAYTLPLEPPALASEKTFLGPRYSLPEDWLAAWDFEHRTALPSNAPSLNC